MALLKGNIFCSAYRTQQCDTQKGGLFLSFVIGIDPEDPQSSPRSLRSLDQGQILKLNLFR